jgi:YggT family protein
VAFSLGMILSDIIQFFSMLIIVWCLLSWFPNIRWYDQPWKTLDKIVGPLVAPFRKLLPPINGLDLSPMIATLILQALAGVIRQVVP